MQHHPARFNHGCPTPGPEPRLPPSNGNQQTNQKEHPVANIKSQLKRIKTNRVATERNKAVRSEVKTWIRKFREAAETGDTAKAGEALKVASTKLDKAVSKGVIHKNQAANKKSAMAKKAASL
jgi:small subunit ribosomal protein S20